MRVHARKRSLPQQQIDSLHTSPLIRRTIVNQTILESPHDNPEGLRAGTGTPGPTRFSHNFSQIPVHRQPSETIQPKLTVNNPGDIYEQEADRVAEQVMRLPESQLQGACACGASCHECQAMLDSHEHLQSQHVESNDIGQSLAPPIVNEVLNSPGQPLDPTARAFMERRFGHNFSQVRVHTDSRAAESAQTMSARAYTVGKDIAFAEGRYQPGTVEGRWLLAHELTHVVQQSARLPIGNPSLAAGSEMARERKQGVSYNHGNALRAKSTGEVSSLTHQSVYSVQMARDCDQEQIDCFNTCYRRKPPWPIDKGSRGHYLYCQSKCLAEYMLCVGEEVAEMAFDTMAAAMEWLNEHPEVVVGTIVAVGAVLFVVATGGSGALVLVAL